MPALVQNTKQGLVFARASCMPRTPGAQRTALPGAHPRRGRGARASGRSAEACRGRERHTPTTGTTVAAWAPGGPAEFPATIDGLPFYRPLFQALAAYDMNKGCADKYRHPDRPIHLVAVEIDPETRNLASWRWSVPDSLVRRPPAARSSCCARRPDCGPGCRALPGR